ncbi:hypothetical protein [Candidatus Phytoplasma fabacearum]
MKKTENNMKCKKILLKELRVNRKRSKKESYDERVMSEEKER